MNMVLSKLN